ncbi:nuclease-related domain-containing protein [Nonomuraea rhodomycinica]|uniref:NERD domain-containing protein n=1 Tax=Nonomuraea rhodomycinica TaxID=1712872 RepID=A0A7Y6IYZ1_9ACTN|nr:nuclease-related domain-containing protein [Nonomuraea rhodomycinica]NUW47022.1 NERD domain-containing protein [Nonomuraea rhodomycinica]
MSTPPHDLQPPTASTAASSATASLGDPPARAGASARAQYRAELAKGRRSRLLLRALKAALPGLLAGYLLGWKLGLALALIIALVDLVRFWRWSSVSAWRKGAAGERATARLLAPLQAEGQVCLHDRAIPGSTANIDHLLIGPTGVWIIDSKKWHRRTQLHGRGKQLWIGRRPAEGVLRGLAYERSAVARVVNRATGNTVGVWPLVAVHGAKVPGIGRPLVLDGITLLRAGQLRRYIRQTSESLSPAQVANLARALDRAFPPYTA